MIIYVKANEIFKILKMGSILKIILKLGIRSSGYWSCRTYVWPWLLAANMMLELRLQQTWIEKQLLLHFIKLMMHRRNDSKSQKQTAETKSPLTPPPAAAEVEGVMVLWASRVADEVGQVGPEGLPKEKSEAGESTRDEGTTGDEESGSTTHRWPKSKLSRGSAMLL